MAQTVSFYLLGGFAFFSMLPAILVQLKEEASPKNFALTSVIGLIGLSVFYIELFSEGWRTDLGASIYVTILVGWALTLVMGLASRIFFPLTVFIQAYWLFAFLLISPLLILTDTLSIYDQPVSLGLLIHISLSVLCYDLITLTALVGLAMTVKEYLLKAKIHMQLWSRMPALVEGEAFQNRLLLLAFLTSLIVIVIGMGVGVMERGQAIILDHKELLSFLTLGAIGLLLLVHYKSGIRGRKAMRFLAVIYVLATLGYPGVKLVSQLLDKA